MRFSFGTIGLGTSTQTPAASAQSDTKPVDSAGFVPITLRIHRSSGGVRELCVTTHPCTIGRSTPGVSVEINLDPDSAAQPPVVSRKHARLDWSGASWTITDLNSQNGVYLNNRKLAGAEPEAIAVGDVLLIGDVRVDVVAVG